MIFDERRHTELYFPLSKAMKVSFDFLANRTFSFEGHQTYEISDGMFAIPQQYTLKKKEDCSVEAHHRYIDIQVMLEGMEYLGYAQKGTLRFFGYDEEHDTERLSGSLMFLPFPKDSFTVLFPQDAHMPGVRGRGSTPTVRKVVIKVPVALWK
jgi:biofilm protein TabA